MDSSVIFQDIFKDRREEYSNYVWANRKISPKVAYKQPVLVSPSSHKEAVLKSLKIQELLDVISKKQNVPKEELEKQVKNILDEIGYSKNLRVVRWLGLVLIKICLRVCSGILINQDKFLQLKDAMGNCPVVFVPSHRSYADFIMLTYVCFNYDVALPAVAAGMDFQGMLGIGEMLRNTGAFYMRRTYNDDTLYWTTFKQYVYQLVTKGDVPMEFFIEGTRSRSNKSLSPKYGLISMILKALFFTEAPDIQFIPVNISYDRILEESLYAFELLGVPKPRETTAGFFKSLSVLKEKYGNIYVNFGAPILAKEFFGDKLDRSVHNFKPLHQQEMTDYEKSLMPSLAHLIIHRQQEIATITIFNVIALILNNNITKNKDLLTLDDLKSNVEWMVSVMEFFGAHVYKENFEREIEQCFTVHQNLIELTSDGKINLVTNNIILDNLNPAKLKAHSLSERTMTYAVPFVMLQIYINPALSYLVDSALILIILKTNDGLLEGVLFDHYHFLRALFSLEFVTYEDWERSAFDKGLSKLEAQQLVYKNSDRYYLGQGQNKRLEEVLISSFEPFVLSYLVSCSILQKLPGGCDEKVILTNIQRILESAINEQNQFIHPYCLNLDTLSNCLNSLSSLGVLNKSHINSKISYKINRDQVAAIISRLGSYIPSFYTVGCFDRINVRVESKL